MEERGIASLTIYMSLYRFVSKEHLFLLRLRAGPQAACCHHGAGQLLGPGQPEEQPLRVNKYCYRSHLYDNLIDFPLR